MAARESELELYRNRRELFSVCNICGMEWEKSRMLRGACRFMETVDTMVRSADRSFFCLQQEVLLFFTEGPLGFQIPLWTTVFFQLIYVAFGEELFWRGFIQSEFGIWIASIGFGFIHFLPGVVWHVMLGADFNMLWGLGQMIFAIAIGFLFGWVRNKTDSVYACVLLHGIYNLSNHLFVPL
ncbi:CPBP family intramembrane glutamic endopeptidase [Virgibacillus halophilus]|uniref:CPBP family intramembrane glutamic endopeptidase n=1 Tax=Tigheibacillus halophilus TaxID=361280 RepID=A0ABU5C5L5_9BACI|nr:CPBP family intramembrane glutamic endopeptidase [Virgibacillus halophilus]